MKRLLDLLLPNRCVMTGRMVQDARGLSVEGFSKIQFISTNISSRRYLPLPVPTEAYELYAFWSFTEIQIDERLKFLPIIKNSKKSIICCNQEFEGNNNFAYLLSREQSRFMFFIILIVVSLFILYTIPFFPFPKNTIFGFGFNLFIRNINIAKYLLQYHRAIE